jgi:hypothetical protein
MMATSFDFSNIFYGYARAKKRIAVDYGLSPAVIVKARSF